VVSSGEREVRAWGNTGKGRPPRGRERRVDLKRGGRRGTIMLIAEKKGKKRR